DHVLYALSHSDTKIADALKFPEFISDALPKAIQQADLATLKRLSNRYPEEFKSTISIEHFTMAIEANSIEIYQYLLEEAAPEVVIALRGPFILHAPKAIEKGNLDILKLLIDNFECQQGSVNAEFFIKLAHENQQWDILNYLINKYPDATKELDSFFKPILESLTAHIDELTINPEPTKNIELITLVKDLIKDNKISSAQLFVLARETALFLKEETTDQYFSTFFIQWSYQNSQWPLLNSLVNQYPNLDSSFEMRLVSAMGQLNQLKIDNEQINEKKMELIAYVKLLENDEKISKAQLVTIVNATHSLLKKDGFITAEEYKALAKNIEGHSNPLMRAIGVAMMVIGALAMVAGTIIAATGIGIIPGSTVAAAGGAITLTGIGLFSGSRESGLAKKVTELSEITDNNTVSC
ncbi:MAG: ankyrin repeat domain-containing protein, partial [Proteobacteria bacterium]|nr:ankyrin repeat domain-containing protein [Pseudomonadota bacterium]